MLFLVGALSRRRRSGPPPIQAAGMLGGESSSRRLSRSREARPFFFGGLCWRVQPSFFDIYEIEDQPTASGVRPLIFGPLCPMCGRVRHRRVQPSSEFEEPFDVIDARCFSPECPHQIREVSFSGGLGYDDAKLDVYKAAQALALSGKPFPPGPCGNFYAEA